MIKHLTKDINLSDKTVLLMGLGLNGGGVGTAKFLAPRVKKLIVTDLKSEKELESSINQLKDFSNIEYILCQHREQDFVEADIVFKGAGIKFSNKFITAAIENNRFIETDIGYFFELFDSPIVGITGSKGKSTTTTLVYELLSKKINNIILGGNITINPLNSFDENKDSSLAVLELSSWQLADLAIHKKSPHIAILTTIFPDHLNYYGTMQQYYEDKKYIFKFQNEKDWVILNLNNDYLFESFIKNEIKANKIGVSNIDQFLLESSIYEKTKYENLIEKIEKFVKSEIGFSLIKYKNQVYIVKSKTFNKLNELLKNYEINANPFKFKKEIDKSNQLEMKSGAEKNEINNKKDDALKVETDVDGIDIDIDFGIDINEDKYQFYKLPPLINLKLPGEHNKTNILLAISCALLYEVSINDIFDCIEKFSGPEFRLQIVRQLNGVTFINDTTATVPDAVATSINAIKGRGRILLIAGGVDKNLPIENMAIAINENVFKLYLLEGSGSDILKNRLQVLGYNSIEDGFNNLINLVEYIYKNAKENDIILLSPGFASFNLFVNEFERGKIFNQAVLGLK
jgi:UDP-N-acetylmuramoylalanine-D-glutamate ligase